MIYTHHSAKDTLDLNYDYTCRSSSLYGKPKGLWISRKEDDRSWYNFCKIENFSKDRLTFAHKFRFKNLDKIIKIDNLKDFDNLSYFLTGNEIYKKQSFLDLQDIYTFPLSMTDIFKDFYQISKGILIDPYVYERRLTSQSFWYYGWDCSSGCIWDLDCLEYLGCEKETIDW